MKVRKKKKFNMKRYMDYVTEVIMNDPEMFDELDKLIQEERRRYVNGEDRSDLGIKRL